ncbi:MAG: hypothetical protein S0880_10420 [Actinomycetota bacterium]|nr:hypothetical protein [Actinomycetota bacterium]
MDASPELARTLDRAEARAWRIREERAGGMGINVRDFGGPVGFVSALHPVPEANRVLGLTEDDAGAVADVVAWFAEQNVPPRIDLAEPSSSPRLEAALRDAGLEPMTDGGASVVMTGRPRRYAPPPEPKRVRRVAGDDVDRYLALQARIEPIGEDEQVRREIVALATQQLTGVHRYVAMVDGDPVAWAEAHMIDGTLYLTGAATVPAHRGVGCHSTLVRVRILAGIAEGSRQAVAAVPAGSTAQRNMERAGLEVAYTRRAWMPPQWAVTPFYSGD